MPTLQAHPRERPVLGQGRGAEARPDPHLSCDSHRGCAESGSPGPGTAAAGPLGMLSPHPRPFSFSAQQPQSHSEPLGFG